MSRSQWFGIALVILGTLLLLNVLGIVSDLGWLLEWWPVLLIVLGVRIILRRPDSLLGGLIMIALGCLLLADNIITDFDFWVAAVPVTLIVIGLGIILRPLRRPGVQTATSLTFAHGARSLDDELISIVTIFSSARHQIVSPNFRGGTVQVIFGTVELDLRPTHLAAMEASLDIESIFGSAEIIVPPTWQVVVEGTPLFGGIENKRNPFPQDSAPILRIRATALFGSIEIY